MSHDPDKRLSRRDFLRTAAGGLVLAALAPRLWPSRGDEPAEAAAERPSRLIVRVERPLDAETPAPALASWLTPNDQLFVRSHFGPPDPALVDPRRWRLRIAGAVERTLEWTLDDLLRLEQVDVTAVVQCSGNGRAFFQPKVPGVQWERGAVGNVRWSGVRFGDLLRRAGLRPDGRHVHLLGADRPVHAGTPLFHRSIPIEKALHPDTILAHRMNGDPLPMLHGAPLRVVAPGWVADDWVKWLTDVTVAPEEPEGYFMRQAYRMPLPPVAPGESVAPDATVPMTTMPVKSLLTAPAEGAVLGAGRHHIQGVAWAGESRIRLVEVSTDGGTSWHSARLVGEDQPYAWRLWQFEWDAKNGGNHLLMARAADTTGHRQPLVTPWNPSGYLWNGVDRVRVTVKV
jgi:DMSO/TMAO reductase YedYZ molybdopterin-dependent catalytic subunit